jgi:mRNA interferase MazF
MQRGEVWLVNLDPTVGAEMRKVRPVVILSSDLLGRLPLRIVVPLTDWKERYAAAPWMLRIDPDGQNGLDKPSSVDCFQPRSISIERFVRCLGNLPKKQMEGIVQRMLLVIQ